MVNHPPAPRPARPLARPFPSPGRAVQLAHRELTVAATGTPAQIQALGDLGLLPRPWDPPSCIHADLRAELWDWLENVVDWFNTEYVWDVSDTIPACWPQHPHLVHEIAVLADQRRRAGLSLTSDMLEDWHRYTVPGFLERMHRRLHHQCEETHQPWPARSRHTRHTGSRDNRAQHYQTDADLLRPTQTAAAPRLGLVDLDTGEVLPPNHHT